MPGNGKQSETSSPETLSQRGKHSKVAGVDENGLGPKLGPLVVTGALFECDAGYDPAAFFEALAAGAGGRRRFGDSKAVMGFSDMVRGEETVLAFARILAQARGEPEPATCFGLLKLLCGIELPEAERSCPAGAATMCFGRDRPLPLFGGSSERIEEAADSLVSVLASAGIRLAAALSTPLCPSRFNSWFNDATKPSKALLDLCMFEDTIRSLAPVLPGEGLYLCGKVMGLARYSAHMSLIREHPLSRLQEAREQSSYDLQGLGEVRFVLDGDAAHGPVAVASMMGKYVRELFMSNVNGFFAKRVEGYRDASGYSDAATLEMIRKAVPVLDASAIPVSCFLRQR